jgi:amino acid adenylation domain-containing protein
MDVSPPTSPPGDLVVRLSQTVAEWPHAIAVEASDATLTYERLDRLSNQLAQRLRALWPATSLGEPRVGVSLRRGAGELVALLATLKAGAAYVPLDPSHPTERLQLVLTDAEPEVMIVNPGSPFAAAAGARPVVILDDVETVGAGYPTTAPAVTVPPEGLAYLMYTSGSTGRPKGVEVTRGALANFLRSMAHTPGLSQADRLLAVTTTAFDISGLELYLPLCVGATVIIADCEITRDPRRLRQRLEQGDITVMQATPAVWRLLLEAGWRGGERPLRMLCGGEGLPAALADGLLAVRGELWNMYGPTETTIWSSLERIEPGYDCITIGRPIDCTRLFVLDEALCPVAPGVDGELAIGGDGLARGYFRRPELTAERFVHHPELGRLYRTGDLARQLPDGRVQWRGRLDHQVKIRGFRVELGEIEARLGAVPGVSHVVVAVSPGDGGDPRLVAYWVGEASRAELVAAARQWLPAAIVPTAWVPLERFGLNANGKVDRKQLPPPQLGLLDAGDEEPGPRPRSDTETRIAAIWREVLGLPQVPVDRDFFTLGGTSVLAARVAMRLQAQTGVEIPLRTIFEAPTIEQLAVRIGQDLDGDAPVVVQLRPGPDERVPVFCLLGVHLYQDLALALHHERVTIGVHVPVRYVPGHGRQPTLPEIAARYVEVIRRHQPRGPYCLVGLCFGGIVAYEVARQLEAASQRVETVMIIDAVLPTAVHVDTGARLRDYAGTVMRAWRAPQELRRRLERQRERLEARLWQRWASRSGGEPRAIDLPIDGPEVEAEVRRFSEAPSHVGARLLVVRATAAPVARWQRIDRDHGWGGRATHVGVHDIAADHLGVMREPHVQSLAQLLDRLEDHLRAAQ